MDELGIYLSVGFRHIIDLKGSDHILFVLALTLRYYWTDWKKLLVLITAFTIGHSITLAISTLNWVDLPVDLIELLIPVTIVFTGLSNFWVKDFEFKAKYPLIYFLALFFGLIHGLGFSNYLKSLLGREQSIIGPLLTFNIGLEIGQLLIVGIILIISFIFVYVFKANRLRYLQIGSGLVLALAMNMFLDRLLSLN
jgi:hydrogenase/urease accessory protein HupE